MKKLIIYEDEEHDLITTAEEVLRVMKETGCTSGIDPTFEIEEQ